MVEVDFLWLKMMFNSSLLQLVNKRLHNKMFLKLWKNYLNLKRYQSKIYHKYRTRKN